MKVASVSPSGDISVFINQALEHAEDGIILFDENNQVLYVNAAAEHITGWPRADIVGLNVGVLAPTAMRERYDTAHYPDGEDRATELMQRPRDVQFIRKDGSSGWIGLTPSRMQLHGRTVNLVFLRDTTARRQQEERTRLLSLAFDEANSAVLVTDGATRILQTNRGFRELMGYDDAQALGVTVMELLAQHEYRPERLERFMQRLSHGKPVISDERVLTQNGQILWCSFHIRPIFDDYSQLVNLVVEITDITHTQVHEALQTKMLDLLVREAPTSEVMTMMCREVERITPDVVASVLRVEDGRLRNLAAPSLPAVYCQAVEGVPIGPLTGCCGTAAFTGKPVVARDIATDENWVGIAHLALDHGLVACWSSPIHSSDGRVLGTFAFYYRQPAEPTALQRRLVDACVHLCSLALEREESRKRIRRLAFYDDLTGLPNRSLLHVDADRAIATAGQEQRSLAVLFLDVDRFKQINDSLGHSAGDLLLKTIADRLREEANVGDIVGRLSGDEFVVVLTDYQADALNERIQSIQRRVAAAVMLEDTLVHPSASIGVSVFPRDGHDMETLLHRADMAMYQAKHDGRNHCRLYNDEMNVAAQERIALETALRDALAHDGLRLHYQPQVNFTDGQLHSVEALSRWHHPQLGEISPMRFIPLAEECGLIGDIDQWALRTACQQLARWRQAGLEIPSVSVNLSPTNFYRPELPCLVQQALDAAGLRPADLTVEITEEVLLDSHAGTLQTLHAVHALGVRLSLDDFGTGYSNLGYLRRLPISELKLDRSFVRDVAGDEIAAALTQAVLHIGKSLNLKVIAEGVETHAQAQLLSQQGYHAAQGYLFARPLPAEDLGPWLQRQHQPEQLELAAT